LNEPMSVWDAVRRHPLLAVLPLVVLTGLGILLGLSRKPVYTATARMYVQVPSGEPSALFAATDAASGLASAYSRAVAATAVGKAVARDVRHDASAASGSTSATPVPDSPIVKVTANASAGRSAVRLANVTADELAKYINRLNTSNTASHYALAAFSAATHRVARARANLVDAEQAVAALPTAEAKTQLESARAAYEVAQLRQSAAKARFTSLQSGQQPSLEPLRHAVGATNDRTSKLELYGFAGFLAGAFAGCGLALAGRALDTRLRNGVELADELDLPLLAEVPAVPRRLDRKRRLVMLERPNGRPAEALRLVRASMDVANADGNAQVVLVVGANGDENKSATTANLGVAFARRGERVALIDLDLRRPHLSPYFGLELNTGVSDVVRGGSTIGDALTRIPLERSNGRNGAAMDVLPAGAELSDPGEFVGSPELQPLFAELRSRYGVVLVDVPPALAAGDAVALSKIADALLVVARPETLSRARAREFRRVLDNCRARKLGVVAVY
jgi:Mrp family chromosome partitioning ATPase/capsular polysaccharide biosynthesis protein